MSETGRRDQEGEILGGQKWIQSEKIDEQDSTRAITKYCPVSTR